MDIAEAIIKEIHEQLKVMPGITLHSKFSDCFRISWNAAEPGYVYYMHASIICQWCDDLLLLSLIGSTESYHQTFTPADPTNNPEIYADNVVRKVQAWILRKQ